MNWNDCLNFIQAVSLTNWLMLAGAVLALAFWRKLNRGLLGLEKRMGWTRNNSHVLAALTPLVLAGNAAAQSVLAGPICKVYNGVFGNDLVSALAFVVFAILLVVMYFDEGSGEKSKMLRFALITAALFNMPKLLALFGVSPC